MSSAVGLNAGAHVSSSASPMSLRHHVSMNAWRKYQEETAQFFRDVGLEAETDVSLGGARTTHDVDVVVRSQHFGFDLLWVVECKHWSRPVTKLHVLGLRQIVTDLGADKGVLLAENGFQRGAREAAELTSVHLTSLADLRVSAGPTLASARLQTLSARLEDCDTRYWSHKKHRRIQYGLRPDIGDEPGFHGNLSLDSMKAVLVVASSGRLPVRRPDIHFPDRLVDCTDLSELVNWLDSALEDFESRLNSAEGEMKRDGTFNPDRRYLAR